MSNKSTVLIVLLALLTGAASPLSACSVPVFRYALERWERDEYRLIVASNGVLSDEYSKVVDELKNHNFYEEGFANLGVHVVDVTDTETNAEVLKTYPELAKVTEPTAFLLYPRGSYLPTIIWKERFSAAISDKLLKSDFIKELTDEILRGTSAVWVVVDSGNKEKDDAAFKVMQETLARLSEEVEMPAGVIEQSGNITGGMTKEDVMANYDPANFLQSGIPLKIGFSVKRLTKDRAEPMFRTILMNIEDDLDEYKDEPMAFPFFGRGRFLVPMIGEGINVENIEMATSYLCGACSCQVKNQNPGVDMLTNLNWYSYLEGSEAVVDKELPPLTGTADLAESVEEVAGTVETEAIEAVAVEKSSGVTRNLLIMFIVILLAIIALSLAIIKKK